MSGMFLFKFSTIPGVLSGILFLNRSNSSLCYESCRLFINALLLFSHLYTWELVTENWCFVRPDLTNKMLAAINMAGGRGPINSRHLLFICVPS
jgi:hypothetical protein